MKQATPASATWKAVLLLASLFALVFSATECSAQVHIRTNITKYIPPRPPIIGFHVGMPQDSAFRLMQQIAARRDTLRVDSMVLLESDSVRIFNQPAYLQLQIVGKRVRTIVVNFHPLSGDRYTNVRDQVNLYLEKYFGRGVVLTNESITYHRWETEDGTSEVSHSDKYMRVFIRLGKPRM